MRANRAPETARIEIAHAASDLAILRVMPVSLRAIVIAARREPQGSRQNPGTQLSRDRPLNGCLTSLQAPKSISNISSFYRQIHQQQTSQAIRNIPSPYTSSTALDIGGAHRLELIQTFD